jgi:hypothetical protein
MDKIHDFAERRKDMTASQQIEFVAKHGGTRQVSVALHEWEARRLLRALALLEIIEDVVSERN